jgi:hypothetical protein
MKEFDSMSVEELEIAYNTLKKELAYQYEIAENIIDYKKYIDKLEEINNIEIQFETVCHVLGLPI